VRSSFAAAAHLTGTVNLNENLLDLAKAPGSSHIRPAEIWMHIVASPYVM
jgi:hypothetical protein